MNVRKTTDRLLAGTILAGASVLGLAGPAMAQDSSADSEIVVTGSRIPRANLTAPTQVTTLTAENLELSGLTNAADILRSVPSFGVSGISSGNSNFFTTSGGINTLELRNLDEDRTLILVNGRRYVSGVPGTSAVDINTIPVEMLDRIEVITGGASAIYGSDALAGVVNFILKDDFEGLTANYQYGESEEGDDVEHRIGITAGGNFANDRGNAVLSVTYAQNDGVLSRNRSDTAVDNGASCVFGPSVGNINACQTSTVPVFSSFSEYGRFFVPSTGASFTVSQGAGPTGTVVPWSTAQFGFNRNAFRRYTVPVERFLVSGIASYDINPSVEAFLETTFAHTETQTELEPFPHSNSDLNIGGIDVNNPFVPAAIRNAVLAAGDTQIEYFRRMTEVGQRGAGARRNTYRVLGGLRGDLDTAPISWETYYFFSRTEDAQQGGGQIIVANMRNALNAVDGDGDPNTFDPVCADPVAVIEGCVPINIFGLGSISQAAADYVRAPTSRQQLAQQEMIGANIGGEAFQLPAGPFQFSLGAEWRRERAEDVPDVLTQRGQNAGNAEAPTFGGYSVGEFFGEIEVPLLKDLALVHDLSFGAAYRYSDYSTIGDTEAYTARLSYSPIEPIRFRAQYARAVRAPNITELYAPGGENFATVTDPCNGVTAASTGQIAQNCLSVPEIAARVAAVGSFTLTQTEIQGTGGFTGSGNQNLSSETSDSYTYGVVLDHNFGAAGALTFSVDYFKIEIEDTITTVARQDAVDLCFDVPTGSFPNQFCQLLVRDTTGAAFQLGELTEVNNGFVNEGTVTTEGVDVSALWSFSLADWFGSVPGDMAIRANYTHLLDFTETQFGQVIDRTGEVGYSEDEWQAALLYTVGPLTFQWETTYIGDAVPNKRNPLFVFNVGEYTAHDLQVKYDVNDVANIYFGVDNIFDEEAPLILPGVTGNTTGTNTNASVYDNIGRGYYAGVRMRF